MFEDFLEPYHPRKVIFFLRLIRLMNLQFLEGIIVEISAGRYFWKIPI